MNKNKKKLKKELKAKQVAEAKKAIDALPSQAMKFTEDKFGKDKSKPLYEKGKVYDIPAGQVLRWVKRGGIIVDNEQAPEVSETKELPVESEPKEVVEAPEEKLEDEA